MSVFICTGAFKDKKIDDKIKIAKQIGIDNIELSSGVKLENDFLSILKNLPKDMNFLIHNYFPPEQNGLVINLASINEKNRKDSIEFCKNSIDLCSIVGSKYYSVHSGFCIDPNPEDLGKSQIHLKRTPKKEAENIFFESLKELLEYAKEKNIELCIENNVIESQNLIDGKNEIDLMANIEDYKKFILQKELEDISFLIDLGHLSVSSKSEKFSIDEFMDVVIPRVKMFHISDNNCFIDENKTVSKGYWAEDILRKNKEHIFVLEAYNLSPDEIVATKKYLDSLKKGV